MKTQHVGQFIDKLMRMNNDKEVWVIWDNYRPHRSIASDYEDKYRGRLHFVFLPPYSPELNPQENIWAWLKDYCTRDSAYTGDKGFRGAFFSMCRESRRWLMHGRVYSRIDPDGRGIRGRQRHSVGS